MMKTLRGCATAYLILDTLHLNFIGKREVTILSQQKKKKKWFYFTLNLKISKLFEFDHER